MAPNVSPASKTIDSNYGAKVLWKPPSGDTRAGAINPEVRDSAQSEEPEPTSQAPPLNAELISFFKYLHLICVVFPEGSQVLEFVVRNGHRLAGQFVIFMANRHGTNLRSWLQCMQRYCRGTRVSARIWAHTWVRPYRSFVPCGT